MALEDIFDEIGGFSRFQWLMIACVYTMKAMVGWSMMQMSFAGLIPDYYCVTDIEGDQSLANNGSWHSIASQSDFMNNSDALNVCSVNGTKCKDYTFMGEARPIISEWDLVCDLKWIKATVTSIQMCGVLVGAMLGGQSGDYFGRKNTTYGWYFFHAIMNVVAAFSVSWEMFTVLRFFLGMGIGAMLVVVVPYPSEFLPLRWRSIIPGIPMWPLGVGFFAGAAWILQDWSQLHIACAAFAAPGLLGYFYIPESVRWLAVQGRLKEAYAVVEKMAHVNGKPVPSHTIDTIEKIAKEEKELRATARKYTYIDVFKGRHMARTTLIFGFKWCSLSIIFYGLSFGVSSFAGNLYLNIFLMGIIEIPANLSTFLLTNKLGRRWTCLGFFVIGCASAFGCLVAHLLAPEDMRGAIISGLSLTAKLGVGACWVASQIWVVESYPTVTRSLGYGAANTAARVGGIIAPFAVNLDDMVVFSYTFIGALQLACLLLVMLIPETKGTILQESIKDQEQEVKVKDGDKVKTSDVISDKPVLNENGTELRDVNGGGMKEKESNEKISDLENGDLGQGQIQSYKF